MFTGGGRSARTCLSEHHQRGEERPRGRRRRPAAAAAGCRRGELDAKSPSGRWRLAHHCGDHGGARACGSQGDVGHRPRKDDAAGTGRWGCHRGSRRRPGPRVRRLQARARVHEHRVEDQDGGEDAHGGRLVADDPGEEREERHERGRRHEDDDGDGHAGQQLTPTRGAARAPRRCR